MECFERHLLCLLELKDAVVEVLPALREQKVSVFLLSKECDTEGIEAITEKIEKASDEPIPPALKSNLTIKSPAVYIYTSGTTGTPLHILNSVYVIMS